MWTFNCKSYDLKNKKTLYRATAPEYNTLNLEMSLCHEKIIIFANKCTTYLHFIKFNNIHITQQLMVSQKQSDNNSRKV